VKNDLKSERTNIYPYAEKGWSAEIFVVGGGGLGEREKKRKRAKR